MTSDELTDINDILNRLHWRKQAREAERRRARRPQGRYVPQPSRNREIADKALVRERVPGTKVEFWITYTGMRETWLRMRQDARVSDLLQDSCDPEALNGYVVFPKRHAPRIPTGTGDLVKYIPVHGGVTWACKDSFAAVWGFDTIHAGSENQPRTDRAWILGNCWILYRGLLAAEKLWPEFRRASEARRIELAQQLLDMLPEQPLNEKLSFDAMISVLFGKV